MACRTFRPWASGRQPSRPRRRQGRPTAHRIAAGGAEVSTPDRRGITTTTGRPDRDHRHAAPRGRRDQAGLVCGAVHRIDHERGVEPKELFLGRGIVELADLLNDASRRDHAESLGHRARLGLPDRLAGRVHLPVDVGDADVVEVHEDHLQAARTDQRLGNPATDSPDPDHGDPSGGHPAGTRAAIQA
jgi:hypothetical protein